jgi:hypothetical protein
MKEVGILYIRLVYFTAIWYILWPIVFSGYLVNLSPFWYVVERKSGNPAYRRRRLVPEVGEVVAFPLVRVADLPVDIVRHGVRGYGTVELVRLVRLGADAMRRFYSVSQNTSNTNCKYPIQNWPLKDRIIVHNE